MCALNSTLSPRVESIVPLSLMLHEVVCLVRSHCSPLLQFFLIHMDYPSQIVPLYMEPMPILVKALSPCLCMMSLMSIPMQDLSLSFV